MLLDEYQERLFVGGRDLVYSLSLERISDGYKEVWKHQTVFQEGKKRREIARCYLTYFFHCVDHFKILSDYFIKIK
jgi:hypothetical protein